MSTKKIKQEAEKLIEVKDLSVHFERNGRLFRALNGVSLDINKGEIVGVVGESGSGKTTLGRALIGLWTHSSGYVKIDGKIVPQNRITTANKKTAWVFKEGQMIFQDPATSLDHKAKVLNIVSEGYKNFKYFEQEKKQKLDEVNTKIEDIKNKIEKESATKNFKIENLTLSYEADLKKLYNAAKKDNLALKEIETLEKEILKLEDQISYVENKLNTNKISLTKQIQILKGEKQTAKMIFNGITKSDNDYMVQCKKEQAVQFLALQEKQKPSKTFMTTIAPEVFEDVKKIIDELNLKFETNKNFEKIKVSAKFFDEAIASYDAFQKSGDKLIALVRNSFLKIKDETLLIFVSKYIDLLKDLFSFKSHINTQTFRFLTKFVEGAVKTNIRKLNNEIKDIEILIVKKANSEKKLAFEFERPIQEDEIASLKYEAILLKEKVQYYEKFYSDFLETIVQNITTDYVKIYNFLIKKNKEIEKIHVYVSAFKYRKKIIRTKDLLRIRKIEFTKTLNDLHVSIDETRALIEHLDSEKIHNDIREKLESQISTIKTEYENNVASLENYVPSENKSSKLLAFEKEFEILNEELNQLEKKYSTKNKKEFITQKVIETLALVGIGAQAINSFPGSFSGGQKQRIGIARAIINNPKFIIADEPISALDVSVQAQVVNLLKDLNKKLGLTIIFIAHDLEMVNYISDKIFVIYKGDIVEYGPTNKVYKNPTHPYTISLMKSIPKIENYKQPLKLSDYNPSLHDYNEYKEIGYHQVTEGHFVRGTEEEFKVWKEKTPNKTKN